MVRTLHRPNIQAAEQLGATREDEFERAEVADIEAALHEVSATHLGDALS
jgi:hypothetical protein